jgi:hypothetical protein
MDIARSSITVKFEQETAMNRTIAHLSTVAALAVLAACAREQPEDPLPPPTASTDPTTTAPPAGVPTQTTAQIWLDDFTLGRELSQDGSVATGTNENEFAPGEPIHLAMEVGDAPAKAAVRVQWVGPGDAPIAEETKTVTPGETYMNFTAQNTRAWQPGDDYRAEVWVEGQKVTELEFDVVRQRAASR